MQRTQKNKATECVRHLLAPSAGARRARPAAVGCVERTPAPLSNQPRRPNPPPPPPPPRPNNRYHLGQLKARLAKLRTQLQEPSGKGGAGEGFDVQKYGDGRVALIGFPSVGKSSLLTELTGTASEAAAYEFTTLTCVPGVIHYNDAKIQLLDLPGIIEGAAEGKGRGRQVIAVCKSADLLLMVLDATKPWTHREILTRELEAVGMRLNRHPPQITMRRKKTGGVSVSSTVPLTRLDEKLVARVLQEYKIHNCDVSSFCCCCCGADVVMCWKTRAGAGRASSLSFVSLRARARARRSPFFFFHQRCPTNQPPDTNNLHPTTTNPNSSSSRRTAPSTT
jgi:small GTP-binding protein